jgi:membrane-bound ClpP family serine protease
MGDLTKAIWQLILVGFVFLILAIFMIADVSKVAGIVLLCISLPFLFGARILNFKKRESG